MAKEKIVPWWEADKIFDGLETDIEHEGRIQREAIPLVFVPGIMGTCLRRAGTNGEGKGPDGLPTMRWNPSSTFWMLGNVSGTNGAQRKAMLVGERFDPGFLEPANSNPVGDGTKALMEDYVKKFLTPLRTHDWGEMSKIFDFPVYAVGYNWTDSSENSGKKLAARIKEIIAEAKAVTGLCEKVIVITHSMGGLVSRWASEKAGAAGDILGIVHGVQPTTGAPAAYWRIKAGFEGFGPTSWTLGNSGENVTPVLGNIPGGLQLLPNKQHRTNSGERAWLTVTQEGATIFALPKADPYKEIYSVKAVVKPKAGEKPSTNAYWGLVDPALLNPGVVQAKKPPNKHDAVDSALLPTDPWPGFEKVLQMAESFHDALGKAAHSRTFNVKGVGHETADVIEMATETKWWISSDDPYPTRGFRGFFTAANGDAMKAVLQDPAGDGDATVVRSSGAALDAKGKQLPGDRAIKVEHQPAYEDGDVQAFAFEAIKTLARARYEDKRHPLGDFPAGGGASNVG